MHWCTNADCPGSGRLLWSGLPGLRAQHAHDHARMLFAPAYPQVVVKQADTMPLQAVLAQGLSPVPQLQRPSQSAVLVGAVEALAVGLGKWPAELLGCTGSTTFCLGEGARGG